MSTSVKPRLRGVSHEIGFFVALVAGIWAIATAGSAVARGVTGIYALTLALMLGVSASYHRGTWRRRAELRWKRADHAMIFLFVAGTYTPICVLAIGGPLGMKMLMLVWTGAALGAAQAVFWVRAPRVVAALLYLALGWLAIAFWRDVRIALGPLTRLLIAGGTLYSIGAIVYALRRPDPLPRWFGYHEVFHVLVIAACACHYVVILGIASSV
jgi:hemolysin III